MQALPPYQPPAIIVTGHALPDPLASRAYDVETIGRTQLADSPRARLDEILKSVPGAQLFRRSDSTSGHPTSQGITLRALGGNASSRALLILDGVPQSDPFGGWVNWPAYDPAGLETVKVVRGGGSVADGPGALAGVIDMMSRSDTGGETSLEAGSRSSAAGHLYLGANTGVGVLTIDAQGGRSDGFVPVTKATRGPVDQASPYSEGSVRTRWIAPVGQKVELQASGSAFIDRRERGTPFSGNRTRGADASLRLVGSGPWQWSATGYGQWRNFKSSFAGVNDDRTEASRVALQYSVPSRGFGGSVEVRPPVGDGFELRIGGDSRFTTGESLEYYSYQGGAPTRQRAAGGDSMTGGMFAEGTWTSSALSLSGGLRIDHWSISNGRLLESVIATGTPLTDAHYPSRDGWLPTGRAGAVLDVGRGLSLRSAAYLGWRMPTLNELFRPFRAGPDATAANPLLDPERSSGAEAGARFHQGPVTIDVTAFVNRLSDAIANVTLGQGPGVFPGVGFVAGKYSQRQNLDAVWVTGIEASGDYRRGPWQLRLGASFTNARVESQGPAAGLDGLRPAQVPKLALTGGIGWNDGRRSASLELRRVGDQFEDDFNSLRIPSATTLDAFLAWPLTSRLQIFARGENLLNETVIAGLDSDGTEERATPRTLWIGIRLDRL